jgi:hypothetical protein
MSIRTIRRVNDLTVTGEPVMTTGNRLNVVQGVTSYDDRAIYERDDGADLSVVTGWSKTFTDTQNIGKNYEGEMPTVRWANATWAQNASSLSGNVTTAEADRNTQHFIDQLPIYRSYGVKCVSVGFECGNPINNEEDPAITPVDNSLGYDINGSPSAFDEDGTGFKSLHLARMESLIEAAAAQRMVVCLQLFYARQCRWLSTTAHYEAAIDTAVDWLKTKGYRNVFLDLANEAGDDPSGNWALGHADIWKTDAGAADMLEYYKTSWGITPNRPPAGVSSRTIPGSATNAESDIVWVHTNVMGASIVDDEIGSLSSLDQPVVVNESDRHSTNRATWLELELDDWPSMRGSGASVGVMLSTAHQRMDTARTHSDSVRKPFMPDVGTSDDLTVSNAQERLRNLTRAWLDELLLASGGLS